MGNISSLARASTALDSYVAELGNDISYEKSLSSSRFLKTILVRHEYGLLVLKLFIKPDPLMTLRVIQRRLKNQRDTLQDIPNVLSYSTFVETDKAGYLIRQWAGSSLYDRISTRPYLATIEKKWIAFQILSSLRDAHSRDTPHGDLKSENILITPSFGVFVTDFASAFKPTFLPLDDPSDFSYFYDSSARRTCYIAPERFYEEGSKVAEVKRAALSLSLADGGGATGLGANWLSHGIGKKDGKITEEMDVFSVACVLVEMWTDGAGLFNLSELYTYRGGDSSGVEAILSSIDDPAVRNMISIMLALDPQNRPSFERILGDYRNVVFPDYFYTFLPDYVISLNAFPASKGGAKDMVNPVNRFEGQSDVIVQKIAQDWSGIITSVLNEHASGGGESEISHDGSGRERSLVQDDGPALLLLNLITSNVRNCLRPSSRLSALKPIKDLAGRLQAEHLSDRIVPYLVALTKDEAAQVRSASCRLLAELLRKVDSVSTANLELVPEYIIPNIRHLAEDDDVYVRCTYAESLPVLAEVALRMLEMGEAVRAKDHQGGDSYDDWKDPDYDATASELQSLVEEQAATLLVDPSSEVKRAALTNASKLCLLFGRQRTNDVLLSRMITYLNDQDWRLRQAFLGSIVSVAAFVGTTSLEEFVLPLLEQALADPEDAVVSKVLASLGDIVELGLFSKARHLEVLSCIVGFLCHPSAWIRQGCCDLIATIARQLSSNDVWCLIYPAIRPLLRSELAALGDQDIADALVEALPRLLVDGARVWAQNSGPKSWWYQASRTRTRSEPLRAFNMSADAQASLAIGLNDVDAKHLAGLRQRGLQKEDEIKLLLLRSHIGMQAAIANRRNLSHSDNRADDLGSFNSKVNLQEHNVMPQTVFIQRPSRTEASTRGRNRRSERDTSTTSRTGLPGLNTGRSGRLRKQSSDHNQPDDIDPVAELRRRLSRLDNDDAVLHTPATACASVTPRTGTDATISHDIHTPAESVASTPMPGHSHKHGGPRAGKSRISVGSDSSKTAPDISAVRAHAIGRLELSAELRFPGTASGSSPNHATPSDTAVEDGPPGGDVLDVDYRTSYEGQDPGIMDYVRSNMVPVLHTGSYDYGPIISVAPERKRQASTKKGSGLLAEEPEAPTPVMIADLAQHQAGIKGIVVAPDHAFFVSVDDSGVCLIWDVHRLERTVTTKSRLAYALESGRITAVSAVPRSHCFAVGTETGVVEICRIWTTRQGETLRFVKVTSVSRCQLPSSDGYPTCIVPMSEDGRSDLLIGTSKSCLLRIDSATMMVCSRMTAAVTVGRVTCLVVDPQSTWLAAGTAQGYLMIWDLRYGILLRQWRYGSAITTCILHPSRLRKRSIVLACERSTGAESAATLIQTVDLVTGAVLETFDDPGTSTGQGTSAGTDQDGETAARAVFSVAQAPSARHDRQENLSGICSILALPTRGLVASEATLSPVGETYGEEALPVQANHRPADGIFVLGSEDHIVRWWNIGHPKESAVISGIGADGERAYSLRCLASESPLRYVEQVVDHSRRRRSRSRPEEETSANLARALRQPLRPHLNAITALAVLETPFSGSSVLVTGDRSGILKVWRMEN